MPGENEKYAPANGGTGKDAPNWRKKAALFLISQNASMFGSSVTGFAIVWHVTLRTSSGLWMTMIVLASILPQVLVSLWGGVWADRYNRKFLIMGADGGIAFATLILALLYMAGYESLELLLAVAAVRSIGSGIQSPAVNAVIPQIVPAERLVSFNGLNQSVMSASQLLAPAAGGVVLGSFGIAWAFMLDVITAAFAIAAMSFVRIPALEVKKSAVSALAEMKKGLAHAWTTPLLKQLIICYGVAFFLITPAAFLTPIMVERSFGGGVWHLTANEIVWTGGTLVGGAWVTWRGNFKNKVRVIAWSLIGFGVCYGLLGAATNFPLYLIFMGVSGLVLPFFTTANTVLIQQNIEADMMGRIFSILQLTSLSAMPVAMLLFGPLADVMRIEVILLVSGALLAAVGFLFMRRAEAAAKASGFKY